jgi:transcriptional regulator with XRE-family HTH domain
MYFKTIMMKDTPVEQRILPSQARAARALIGWSQENLAEQSGISISTVRDFESGRRDAAPENEQAIRKALEKQGGIKFLPRDKNAGPGVRLELESPVLTRRPTMLSQETGSLPFDVRWRGTEIFVYVSRKVLDDFNDRDPHANFNKGRCQLASDRCVDIFNKHEAEILDATARAIYAGRIDDQKRLVLRPGDFSDSL